MTTPMDAESSWEGYSMLGDAIRKAAELPDPAGAAARQALKQFFLRAPLPSGLEGAARDVVNDAVRGFEMAEKAFGPRPPDDGRGGFDDTDWGYVSTIVDEFLAREGYVPNQTSTGQGLDGPFPGMDEWPDFSAEPEPFPFEVGSRLLPFTLSEAELRRKSDAGDPRAIHDLALLVWGRAHGRRGAIFPDGELLQESIGLFRKAADAGLPEGKFALGFVEVTVVGMKNLPDAADWFEEGAALGHPESKRALAWMSAHVHVHASRVRR